MRSTITRRMALKGTAIAGAVGASANLASKSGFSLIRPAEADDQAEAIAHSWWKEAVVYQIYPRSFADSNGDGIGDIRGIIGKLDHLKDLGVNVVWLGPHYDTPNIDGGYDIRDYRKVNPDFGTLEDFDALVAGLKERGIKLVVDLVVNHTSDEHVWFQESRKSRDNPYRDFYIWRDPKPDGSAPTNYPSLFSGPAWQKDDTTGQYYLHYFAVKQPDLNWDNPKVRHEVHDIMRFWLDRGVSGFRMDVITFVSKPKEFHDLTAQELKSSYVITYASGPHIHDYLHEMNREVLAKGDYMALGEAAGLTPARTPLFISQKRQELGMVFHFDIVSTGRAGWKPLPRTLVDIKKAIMAEATAGGPDGWATSYFENHDNPRSVSSFGDNSQQSAKALALLLIARPGTPFIYQGQEIGMTNIAFHGIQDFQDISAINYWKTNVPMGKVSAKDMLDGLRETSRDNSRTPMQWESDPNGGFTTGKPWFRVNPNTKTINVAAQQHDPHSVMSFYRNLLSVRAAHPDLVYSSFQDIAPEHQAIIAYVRESENGKYLFLINMSAKPQSYRLPDKLALDTVLIDTQGHTSVTKASLRLAPWQATLYTLKA